MLSLIFSQFILVVTIFFVVFYYFRFCFLQRTGDIPQAKRRRLLGNQQRNEKLEENEKLQRVCFSVTFFYFLRHLLNDLYQDCLL